MIEASPAIRAVGSKLAENVGLQTEWRAGDLVKEKIDFPQADLVTIAYVLDELAPLIVRRLSSGYGPRLAICL